MSNYYVWLVLSCFNTGCTQFTGWTIPEIDSAVGSGNVTLYENQPVGLTQIKFRVKEDDTSVVYRLEQQSDVFEVRQRGRLLLKAPLDTEVMNMYVLEISARTNSGTTASSVQRSTAVANVTIHVHAVNNLPAFTMSSYGAWVADRSTSGTSVIKIDVTCLSSTVSYTITDGNTNNDFSIDNTTGVISVAPGRVMDSSVTEGYALHISMKDEDEESTYGVIVTTTVVIVVGDAKCSIASTHVSIIMSFVLAQILHIFL